MTKPDFKQFKTMPIKQLVKADWNYKEDDDEKKEKLKQNLKRNGQVENILVRCLKTGFYEVVNGNHRYEAMLELGYTDIVVYDLGTISNAAAYRIALETNETRFNTNTVKMAELVTEILGEFSLEEIEITSPFSTEQLDGMTKILNFSWDQYGSKEGQESDGKEGKASPQFLVCVEAKSKDEQLEIKTKIEEMGYKVLLKG